MTLYALLVIHRRFNSHRTADKERIAHLYAGQYIVIAAIGMYKLAVCAKKNTVLCNIVAATGTYCKGITPARRMLKAHISQQHQVIIYKITTLPVNVKIKLVSTIVAQIKARK